MNDLDSRDNNLKNIQEKIKPKRRDRNGLSSRERHEAYIQKYNNEAKEAKAGVIFFRICGGLMLAVTIYIWYSICKMSPMSSWGVIVGFIAAGIFKAIYPDGLNPNNKTQKYIVLIFGGGIIILMNTPSASEFTIMLLPSVISALLLFGIVKNSGQPKPQV
jgi:hypothetical protein